VAAALGSGVAFLDGSVVNVALPAIGRELGGGFSSRPFPPPAERKLIATHEAYDQHHQPPNRLTLSPIT